MDRADEGGGRGVRELAEMVKQGFPLLGRVLIFASAVSGRPSSFSFENALCWVGGRGVGGSPVCEFLA